MKDKTVKERVLDWAVTPLAVAAIIYLIAYDWWVSRGVRRK